MGSALFKRPPMHFLTLKLDALCIFSSEPFPHAPDYCRRVTYYFIKSRYSFVFIPVVIEIISFSRHARPLDGPHYPCSLGALNPGLVSRSVFY